MTDFWDKIAGVYDLAESINGDVYHEMCAQTERLVPAGAKVLDCAAGHRGAFARRRKKCGICSLYRPFRENAEKRPPQGWILRSR